MTIIEQLEDADKTLAADGYKEYSYVRIAISEAIRALRQPPVMPSCGGNCGMNYCDDNGCIERKRVLVEPTDLPEHGA